MALANVMSGVAACCVVLPFVLNMVRDFHVLCSLYSFRTMIKVELFNNYKKTNKHRTWRKLDNATYEYTYTMFEIDFYSGNLS